MKAHCIICTDSFCPSERDVAAMPCGHTFHKDCLGKWVASKKTCPQCRKPLGRNQSPIQKLYFIQDLDGSQTTTDEDFSKLRNKLSDLTLAVQKSERERDAAVASLVASQEDVKAFSREVERAAQKLSKEKGLHGLAKKDLAFYKGEYEKQQEAVDEAKQARSELTKYKNLQTVVKASEEEVSAMLGGSTSVDDSHKRELATYAMILKRELENVKGERKLLQEHLGDLSKEKKTQRRAMAELRGENERLHHKVSSLSKDLEQLEKDHDDSVSRRNSSSKRLSIETPGPSHARSNHLLTSGQKRAFATPPTPAFLSSKRSRHDTASPSKGYGSVARTADHEQITPPQARRRPHARQVCRAPSPTVSEFTGDQVHSSTHSGGHMVSSLGTKFLTSQKNGQSSKSTGMKRQNSGEQTGVPLSSMNIFRRGPQLGNSETFRLGYDGVGGHKKHVVSSRERKGLNVDTWGRLQVLSPRASGSDRQAESKGGYKNKLKLPTMNGYAT